MAVKLHTNFGVITLELDHQNAPITAANFEQYVKDGFYDGVIFHRVIKGFMIQGGGMDADMNEKPTRESIQNEAHNGLKNDKYTIAMARTSAPHSASAQFFINTAHNDFLNFRGKELHGKPVVQEWGYAVFGKVTDGFDAVDAIENVATKRHGYHDDVPVDAVVITKAEIV
ncbi:peptidylprolyl isomerase [Alysiella filiformis]|uniref:Peptidyl-prolyl cis-trans isomerase n=1 Tax=Alysiella filiformis DSM 16848 TaxID=1120981 RepID=A0A286EGX5_9NEIS|nr:peptidylprolyl isomerase [Alysiella filiformis]QMT32364.1 peptidylprolyl isomerase [Alysiella filiformis]UBQ56716.1 peptidylprolyl isomerase [Alysiella filiformis DSM 16848]SOD70175.1 peptidyl-prolyl cis-trans isomerase B (cyclophilin B) [Alysiella filiformis DSM 16848]